MRCLETENINLFRTGSKHFSSKKKKKNLGKVDVEKTSKAFLYLFTQKRAGN